MIGIGRPDRRKGFRIANRASGSQRPGRAGRYLNLQAARGLVGLATSVLRIAAGAYRCGYFGLAEVEYCLDVSAKLRARARRLLGTAAGNARNPRPSAEPSRTHHVGARFEVPVRNIRVTFQLSFCRIRPPTSGSVTLLLTRRLR